MKQTHFSLRHVATRDGCKLHLAYADGFEAVVDLADVIERHPTLQRLRARRVFQRAALDEWKLGVVFDADDQLSLPSDTLRAIAVEQAGGFSHQQIITWMARHRMSLDAAADALGISRRMLAYYRSGQKPVPRSIGLAMIGWEVVDVRGVQDALQYNAA